tara:strand:+ start:17947 stop:18882 length:936 start_codon:yes stop_codon:yes gene_type:complete
MKRYQTDPLLTLCLAICLILFNSFARSQTTCHQFYQKKYHAQPGHDLGPIEAIRSLKQYAFPAKLVRNFSEEHYRMALNRIAKDDVLVPSNTEEFTALLDSQLSALNMSTTKMLPIFKYKAYKTIEKILTADGFAASSLAKELAHIIFRGHFKKPTSFAYLLTHSPKETRNEQLLQHLQAMAVTDIVVAIAILGKSNTGPVKPNVFSRYTPQFIKDRTEEIRASSVLGLSLLTWKGSGEAIAALGPFNIFKTKSYDIRIQKALAENDLHLAYEILKEELSTVAKTGYTYAVAEKILNWYFIYYVLSPFFTN